MNVNVKAPEVQNAPSVVRLALPEDAHEIWRLFLQSHRENGLFTLAPEKVTWFLSRALCPETISPGDTGARCVIGVIGAVGNLEAIVLLAVTQQWYSNEYHMEEWMVFTDPEHRRSRHAEAIVKWMRDQVEIQKMPLITGIISNIRTEAKCRLYRRMLPKAGEFFVLTPKCGSFPLNAVASSS